MLDEELISLSADRLLQLGKSAARKADASRLRACLRELECRGSRAAAAAERELRALKQTLRATVREPEVAGASDACEIDAIALVKDAEIRYRRLRMIEQAQKSIWLSSLTFLHKDLVSPLERKSRSGVHVTFVASRKTVRSPVHDAQIRRLAKAGAHCRFLDSTHSKAMVVDEALVLIGSANAHGGHRDLCICLRDEKLAAQIIHYLSSLSERESDGARRR